MSNRRIKRLRLLITLGITALLVGGTFAVIQFAKGYRPSLQDSKISGTGLLSSTSYPKSAQVFVNGRLTTLTDDTLYLRPANYDIEIKKEGFISWKKTVLISEELVSQANARLFPSLPAISPTSYSGAQNPILSHDNTKIIYLVDQASQKANNGLYVLSLNNSLLGGTQITQITTLDSFDYSTARLYWTPDDSQILAVFVSNQGQVSASHLLNAKSINNPRDLIDTTVRLPLLIRQWQDQLIKNEQTAFNLLPEFMVNLLTHDSVNVYFSPDKEKILYTPNKAVSLPQRLLKEDLPSINPTLQQRNLVAYSTYVYDIKEGTNYLIKQSDKPPILTKTITLETTSSEASTESTSSTSPSPQQVVLALSYTDDLLTDLDTIAVHNSPLLTTTNLNWYPTSNHILIVSEDKVEVIEYDGLNRTTLFQTPIFAHFAAPSPDGHHLIILTDLNQPDSLPNFFSLDLK